MDSLNQSPTSSLLETDYSIDLNEIKPQSDYIKPRYNQVNHDFCNLNTAKPQLEYHERYKKRGSSESTYSFDFNDAQSQWTYEYIDFKDLKEILHPELELIAKWLCPGGKMRGVEYMAINPTRPDSSLGSFSINVKTGKWADFASGDRGLYIISYCAYVKGFSQIEAARFFKETKEGGAS